KFTSTSNDFSLPHYFSEIEKHFSKNTMEEIIFSLENEKNEWCQQTVALLKTKSPTSLKVTLRELQQGAELNFDDCMKMESCLMQHFLKGHDFYEGVRAVLIDKDQSPHWQPPTLSAV